MSDFEAPDGPAAPGPQWPPPPAQSHLPPPPPLPPPHDLETTVVTRGRGRRVGLVIGVVLIGALVVGGLAFLAQGDDADAAGSLAAAQAVVADSDSYRFELLTVSREVIGDPDGAGSDTTTRTLTTGDIAAADEWHLVEDMGDEYDEDSGPLETIRVGDTTYVNDPYAATEGVDAPAWIAAPAQSEVSAEDIAAMYEGMFDVDDSEGFDDVYRLDLMTAAYLYDLEGQPTALTRLVTEATEPVIEEQLADGGVRLRVRLAPLPELAEVADDPIPPVDLLLDLNADDQPVRAAFTAEAGSASSKIEVTYSDWGADLSVAPPADSDIDHTPWLAEEALAQVDPALLVAPSVLPEGQALVSADVYSDTYLDDESDGSGEDDGCDSVELSYGVESDFAFGLDDPTVDMSEADLEEHFADFEYLSLSVSRTDCYLGITRGEFPDELGGLPASGGDGYWEVQFGDDVVVTINTSYDDDELAPLVASIAPVTVEQLAASVPEWAASSAAYGAGWYSGGFGFGP